MNRRFTLGSANAVLNSIARSRTSEWKKTNSVAARFLATYPAVPEGYMKNNRYSCLFDIAICENM